MLTGRDGCKDTPVNQMTPPCPSKRRLLPRMQSVGLPPNGSGPLSPWALARSSLGGDSNETDSASLLWLHLSVLCCGGTRTENRLNPQQNDPAEGGAPEADSLSVGAHTTAGRSHCPHHWEALGGSSGDLRAATEDGPEGGSALRFCQSRRPPTWQPAAELSPNPFPHLSSARKGGQQVVREPEKRESSDHVGHLPALQAGGLGGAVEMDVLTGTRNLFL